MILTLLALIRSALFCILKVSGSLMALPLIRRILPWGFGVFHALFIGTKASPRGGQGITRTFCHRGAFGKALRSPQRRLTVRFLIEAGKQSIAKACAYVGLSRRALYRRDPALCHSVDVLVVDGPSALVERRPRWGFWRMFHALRLRGHRWNHKHVWRVYRAMKLNPKRRSKRRLPDRSSLPLAVAGEPNHTRSFDLMSDRLYSGYRYRAMNII